MKPWRLLTGILGIVLLLASFWGLHAETGGLQIVHDQSGTLPLTFIGPQGGMDGTRPLVLIGHGFAGSSVIMRGFALTFARAGYVTASWDFDGHGANPQPLPAGSFSGGLVKDAEMALERARQLGLADPGRVAILGHSMGSGVALSYGQAHPETMATIAVSPVSTSVTPELPRDLLLMAGSREPAFVGNAQALLAEAGGAGGDPTTGTGRKLVVVPGVEHISILFSGVAQKAALDWLDATFGPQPGAVPYADRRMIWYGLGVLGTLLAALCLVHTTTLQEDRRPQTVLRRLLALVVGALGATLVLWLFEKAGLGLTNSFGILVGGYLILWFGVAGAIALLVLGGKTSWPVSRAFWLGILIFGFLWVGIGLLGSQVWLPWLLIPRRLVLWPLGALLALPWFLATGEVARPARPLGRLGWWLASSLTIVGGLSLAMQLSSGLFFLSLILPLFPIILGMHAVAAGRQRDRWAFGLSAALFISWVTLAVFPLQ